MTMAWEAVSKMVAHVMEGPDADEVPQGPGGADRGKTPVPGDPCYLCEVVGGRGEKGIVEEADLTLTVVNWAQFELG